MHPAEQQSPFTVAPSSHSSPASTTPFPHEPSERFGHFQTQAPKSVAHCWRAGAASCAQAALQAVNAACAALTQVVSVGWQSLVAAERAFEHVPTQAFWIFCAGASQVARSVKQLRAHVTPAGGAKQLR